MKDEVQRRRWIFDEGVSIEQGSIIMAKAKKMKVLVVDDDQEMRDMLCSFLTYRGYSVKIAQDGIKGLAELEKDLYDLLITDIYMPGMGGLELLENIDKRNWNLPVLAMTGMPSKKINEAVAEKGAYACLVKPFPLSLLATTIEKCFKQSGIQESPSDPVSGTKSASTQ